MAKKASDHSVSDAIKAARARLADVSAKYQHANERMNTIRQQAAALNAEGIELEKLMLGIQGELTALEALQKGGS